MTHEELVCVALRWLGRFCRYSTRETQTLVTDEFPDAIGWYRGGSAVVECKASRADFLTDKKKPFRAGAYGANGVAGMGAFRWYMAPKGILRKEEIPDRWGLLEVKGGRVYETKISCVWRGSEPGPLSRNWRQEIDLLTALLRNNKPVLLGPEELPADAPIFPDIEP